MLPELFVERMKNLLPEDEFKEFIDSFGDTDERYHALRINTLKAKATITRGIFEAIKGTPRKLTVKAGENEMLFKGEDIKTSKDIEADISYELASEDKDLKDLVKEDGIVVYFADNGQLPGKATIRIKVTNAIKETLDLDKIYVYYYNEKSKEIEELFDRAKYKDGYIEFEIEHNSKYVLVSEEIEEKEATVEEPEKEAKKEKENEEKEVTFLESNKMYIIIIAAAVVVIIVVIIIIIVNKKKKAKKQEDGEEIDDEENDDEENNEDDEDNEDNDDEENDEE